MKLIRDLKTILFLTILTQSNAIAQITKSAFSVKVNYGYSFSKFTLQQDYNIENRNALVLSPQLSYTILTRKRDLIEVGIGYFKVGNKIGYYDNAGVLTNSIFNTNQVWGIPISYYKNIDKKNNQIYIGLGTLFCYNFSKSIFTNSYIDYTETTTHKDGFKINISGSMRYFFTAKKRNFSLELTYSQGLVKYYDVNITSNYYPSQNTIINNGSGLYLGISYFFLKKEKEVE